MAENVPATILSHHFNVHGRTSLVIGKASYPPKADLGTTFYWYTIVDLRTLAVVEQAVSTSTDTVPQNILKYEGDPNHFLFFGANTQTTHNIPQGDLARFLRKVGSGPGLERGEQIVEQLGTGNIVHFSYVLAATCSTNDLPGFEIFSIDTNALLTMEFMPVKIGDTIIYAPVQIGKSTTRGHH